MMPDTKYRLDPVFTSARREALFILALFACCFAWSLGVYFVDGYYPDGDIPTEVPTMFGMPRWVFWGICLPWLFVDAVTIWFVFFFMRDNELGETEEK